MTKITWAVQTNLLNVKDIAELQEACEQQGHNFHPLKIIPFSTDLPDVPTHQPTIFYGSARQTITIARSQTWTPGVFFDEVNFLSTSYITHLGALMLNHDALQITPRELVQHPDKLTAPQYFVRPNNDSKSFAGQILSTPDLMAWATRLIDIPTDIDADHPLILAPPKHITSEWRIFMRDTEVITASRYQHLGQLAPSSQTPQEVLAFATQCATRWHPARAYVMDIAQLSSGELKVIEFNGINSSGFYHADKHRFVAELSAISLEEWQKLHK